TIPISVRISEFKQKKEKFKLITFQNIESELNEKELLSWHKLIRVLTHEINNSISPITSLASSLEKLFVKSEKNISVQDVDEKIIKKTSEGLQLITKRGEGLINFVNNYKSIASIKQMDFEKIKVAELLYNMELLMRNKLTESNIVLKIEIQPIDLEINADKKYIEQVFINLIKNSIEAISDSKGIIKLNAYKTTNKKVIIEIQDSGKGIDPSIMDQIFIPFFSTKEKGSGIGLSLAQQIMQLHGGSITAQTLLNTGTKIKLNF
ncbi:MAG: ATP-binding protein, partial [Marinilabiliales bacterium]